MKLAAPDMDSDEPELVNDEGMDHFSIMHALTGAVVVPFYALSEYPFGFNVFSPKDRSCSCT